MVPKEKAEEKTMANTTLKVLTKRVNIRNEEFVLVEITRTDNGMKFIGTIPYSELDDKGCMKRELNGLEMCLTDSIPHALEMRDDEIATRNLSETEMINYWKNKLAKVNA